MVLDEVTIDPGRSGPPYPFELLYDRTQSGGTGIVVVEVRREGRILLGTSEGVPVRLDGTPAMLTCRLLPPRRSVGPLSPAFPDGDARDTPRGSCRSRNFRDSSPLGNGPPATNLRMRLARDRS